MRTDKETDKKKLKMVLLSRTTIYTTIFKRKKTEIIIVCNCNNFQIFYSAFF